MNTKYIRCDHVTSSDTSGGTLLTILKPHESYETHTLYIDNYCCVDASC